MKAQEPGTLATRTTIRQILGCTRQHVANLVRDPGFPDPIDIPDAGTPVWDRTEVERWKAERDAKHTPGRGRRPPYESKAAA